MKHIKTKDVMLILLMFVVITGWFKSHDFQKLSNRTDVSRKEYATVEDALFLYELSKDCSINVDSFYGDKKTIFSQVIRNKESVTRGFESNTIYDTYCIVCHEESINLTKNIDTLTRIVMEGDVNGMPPKGLCTSCTESDIKSTILWMKQNLHK